MQAKRNVASECLTKTKSAEIGYAVLAFVVGHLVLHKGRLPGALCAVKDKADPAPRQPRLIYL